MKPSDIAKHLGYVPQSLSSAFPFTVRDIVVMGRASHIRMFSLPSSDDIDIAGNAMKSVYDVDVKILQVENTVERKICVPLLLESS